MISCGGVTGSSGLAGLFVSLLLYQILLGQGMVDARIYGPSLNDLPRLPENFGQVYLNTPTQPSNVTIVWTTEVQEPGTPAPETEEEHRRAGAGEADIRVSSLASLSPISGNGVLSSPISRSKSPPSHRCLYRDSFGRRRHKELGESICLPPGTVAGARQLAYCMTVMQMNGRSGNGEQKWQCNGHHGACWMPCMFNLTGGMNTSLATPECSCDPKVPSRPVLPAAVENETESADCSRLHANCPVFGKCVDEMRESCFMPWLYFDVPCVVRQVSTSSSADPNTIPESKLNGVRSHDLSWSTNPGKQWARAVSKCVQENNLKLLLWRLAIEKSKIKTSKPAGESMRAFCREAQWSANKLLVRCHREARLPRSACELPRRDRELIVWTQMAALGHGSCEIVRHTHSTMLCNKYSHSQDIWTTSHLVTMDIDTEWGAPEGGTPCPAFIASLTPCRKWRKVVAVVRERLGELRAELNRPDLVTMGPGPAVGVQLLRAKEYQITSNVTDSVSVLVYRTQLLLQLIVSPVLIDEYPDFDWNSHLRDLAGLLSQTCTSHHDVIRFRVSKTTGSVYRASVRVLESRLNASYTEFSQKTADLHVMSFQSSSGPTFQCRTGLTSTLGLLIVTIHVALFSFFSS